MVRMNVLGARRMLGSLRRMGRFRRPWRTGRSRSTRRETVIRFKIKMAFGEFISIFSFCNTRKVKVEYNTSYLLSPVHSIHSLPFIPNPQNTSSRYPTPTPKLPSIQPSNPTLLFLFTTTQIPNPSHNHNYQSKPKHHLSLIIQTCSNKKITTSLHNSRILPYDI